MHVLLKHILGCLVRKPHLQFFRTLFFVTDQHGKALISKIPIEMVFAEGKCRFYISYVCNICSAEQDWDKAPLTRMALVAGVRSKCAFYIGKPYSLNVLLDLQNVEVYVEWILYKTSVNDDVSFSHLMSLSLHLISTRANPQRPRYGGCSLLSSWTIKLIFSNL